MVTERDSIFFGFFILKYEFGPVMLPGLSRNGSLQSYYFHSAPKLLYIFTVQ